MVLLGFATANGERQRECNKSCKGLGKPGLLYFRIPEMAGGLDRPIRVLVRRTTVKSIRHILSISLIAVFAICFGAPAFAQSYYPGGQTSILPNFSYPAQTFTATAQTGTAIGITGLSTGTILVKGTALTTATFAIQGSNDGGTTWFGLNTAALLVPGTVAATQTATASALYIVNLAGFTNIRFVTSGTFTATSITIKLTGSSNKGLL